MIGSMCSGYGGLDLAVAQHYGQDVAWHIENDTAPSKVLAVGAPRLSPRAVEFMMGLPAGWVTDVDGLTRNSQLKILGNGVVPQQALLALNVLAPVRAAT